MRPASHQLLSLHLPPSSAVEKFPIYTFLTVNIVLREQRSSLHCTLCSFFLEPVSGPSLSLPVYLQALGVALPHRVSHTP